MKNIGLAAILTAGLAAHAQSDTLLVAAMHLRESAESNSACDPDQAVRWAKEAGRLAASATTSTTAGVDTRALLARRAAEAERNAAMLRAEIGSTRAAAARLRKEAQLESAANALANLRSSHPNCAGLVADVASEIDGRRAQATALTARGDETLSRNPKAALEMYKRALEINRQQPGIFAKIQAAKAAKRPRSYKAAKVALWMTFSAALAGGVWVYADRNLQR